MDREDTKNYKINRKVLWLTRGFDVITYKDPNSQDGVLCHGMQGVFDPCNNPSDAWPIIVKYEIGIEKDTRMCCEECREFYTSDLWVASDPLTNDFDHLDFNPLRAAMICFLKMKGAE